MLRLNIEIPDDLREKVQARASESGFATIEAYATWLISDDANGVDYGAPEHLEVKLPEQLEAMLLQAMQSPAREFNRAEWEEKRRKLVERVRQSKAG